MWGIAGCSLESVIALVNPRSGVWFDTVSWETWRSSEVTLGLTHGWSSKEKSVGSYYNYKLEWERDRENRYCSNTRLQVNVPDGVFMISSSIVWQDPPALVILARAASVNLRAATDNFGISPILASSVTVPTTTTVLSLFAQTRR